MYYVYHPETFEFIKVLKRKPRNKDNVTKIPPRKDCPYISCAYFSLDYVYVFNVKKQEWIKRNEYREYRYNEKSKLIRTKFQGYRIPVKGDTSTSPVRYNKRIQSLPRGAVIGNLPIFSSMVRALREIYQIEYDKRIFQLLKIKNSAPLFCRIERTKDGEKFWEFPTKSFSVEVAVKLNLLTRAANGNPSASSLVLKEWGEINPETILNEIDIARTEYIDHNIWLDEKERELSYKEVFPMYQLWCKA